MNKYKVYVYAICRNEGQFVNRWLESMNEADGIYVLDTGSTDNTVELLKKGGAIVKEEIINPWRFDVARNKSLDMVPIDADICVCTDLDEVIEKGWRKKLESVWSKGNTTRCRYIYNWSLDEFNKPIVSFYAEKVHSRKDFKWIHPVHEILNYDGNEQYVTTDDIVINHYPDSTKSRSSYLPLLELSVKENPTNDRNMHYLGREYMFYGKWNESIDTLIQHLKLPSATWKDERCASMRFIARCYTKLKRYDEAKMWLDKAIAEAPYLRDPYIERALLDYELSDWNNVIKYSLDALRIESHQRSYINEVFSWDHTVYDLLSIAYYNINDFNNSAKYINKAIELAPNDERLINNKKIIDEKLNTI